MSWQAVARKDFQDAIRSKLFWALAVIFGLLSIGVGGAYGYFDAFKEAGAANQGLLLVQFVSTPVGLFVTLTAVIICHKAIVGERDSGSLKILLSLPHTRLDVIIGKIVGRTGVVAVPALISLVLGVGIGSALIGDFAAVPLLVLMVAMVVLIFTYVSLMVGLSAMTESTTLATFGAIAYFFVFEIFWNIIGIVLLVALVGTSNTRNPNVDWYFAFMNIPPGNAFNTLLNKVLVEVTGVASTASGDMSGAIAASSDAFYATPWLAIPILTLWIVVPAAIGYKRFSSADL